MLSSLLLLLFHFWERAVTRGWMGSVHTRSSVMNRTPLEKAAFYGIGLDMQ
jgi:hypothetical protein